MVTLGKATEDNLLAVILGKAVEGILAVILDTAVRDKHLATVVELVGIVVDRLAILSRVAVEHILVVDLSKVAEHTRVAVGVLNLGVVNHKAAAKEVLNPKVIIHTVRVVKYTTTVVAERTAVVVERTAVVVEPTTEVVANHITEEVIERITKEDISLVNHIVVGERVVSTTSKVQVVTEQQLLVVVLLQHLHRHV